MPAIQVTIHHKLSEKEAMSRIRHVLTKLKHEHKDKVSGIHEEWDAKHGKFSFTIKGFHLSGTLDFRPGTIELHGRVPLALSFFRGKIKEVIREKAGELLTEDQRSDRG